MREVPLYREAKDERNNYTEWVQAVPDPTPETLSPES